jgi:predicted DNA-binding transcriptional regulator AlpA
VIAIENWKPEPEACDERARLSRRAQRYDRYQQVMALYEQGLGFTEMTRRVGLSRRTIERWIKEGAFPEAKRRRKRRSIFDPYAEYVLSRWEQGCMSVAVKRDYHSILTEESVCKEGAEHAGDQLELLSFSGSEPDHTGFPRADGKRTEVSEYH